MSPTLRRLDTTKLLEIGVALGTEPTPAIAALCMRLARYARAIDRDVDDSNVGVWAAHCFRDWLTHLNDVEVAAATLATDPVNLILGALSLPDRSLAQRLLEAFVGFCRGCADAGIRPISKRNQAAVGAILPAACLGSEASWLVDSLTDGELADELSPFSCATLALRHQRRQIDARNHLSKAQLAALGLRSVWMHDLAGTGLALLSSVAIHGEPLPAGLSGWVNRVTRCDGFIGMWQLHENPYQRANLLGTTNIYWGLATMTRGFSYALGHEI